MPAKTDTVARHKPASRRKPASRGIASSRKKKQAASRTMPVWVRNLLAFCIIAIFSAGFYWFFIRPYAYRWKPCYGLKGYGVCMPCNYEVHGIDISHYQGIIDWDKLFHNKEAKFPIHFIFMKATEGGDYGDENFTENFGQARKHGFIRGLITIFCLRRMRISRLISLLAPYNCQRGIFRLFLMWKLRERSHRKN